MNARAYIRLPSGRHMDLINPDPHSWTDDDLAHKIARVYRWAGESKWPLPLPVAQHCLMVLALRRQWAGGALTSDEALAEQLHDAEEAFTGFDPISPLKAFLGPVYKELADRVLGAVWLRYGLPTWGEEQYRLHKRADTIVAASEAYHCTRWSPTEISEVLRIDCSLVLDEDPLQSAYPVVKSRYRPWEPWDPEFAAHLFAQELQSLLCARADSRIPSLSLTV